jgi:amidase
MRPAFEQPISRRRFLEAAALGSAAMVAGGAGSAIAARPSPPVRPRAAADEGAIWFERSILELQALMAAGELTSVELTRAYLDRIATLNPVLHAVIQTSPDAIAIAHRRDAERHGHVRGPLHGIPILLKDNIATHDRTETTAGSLALVGSKVRHDATLVDNLRRAGAVILGKANLSEWANFRGNVPDAVAQAGLFLNGWSGRGGFTRDPYVLSWDPCGSSSGSAVAAAANLCAAAVGTETDGSVVCPSGNNAIVGLKPTLGLVSQRGIIPIAHSQDTAGPMGRTVTDVAIMLNAMASPFGPVAGHAIPRDYTAFVRSRGALNGARIGVDRRLFQADHFADVTLNPSAEAALEVMQSLGATIIDPVDAPDPLEFSDDEFTVLLCEFKDDIAKYLAGINQTSMRTLADLIAFDDAHCEEEMKYFGQEVFEAAEATGGTGDPTYAPARAHCIASARDGLDRVIADNDLDAIVSPIYSFGSTAPAVAGYPNISIPTGVTEDGRPGGVWMYSGFLQEPKLLAMAYDLEQEIGGRPQPQYLGSLPPLPPDAGLCPVPTAAARVARKKHAAMKARRHGKRMVG